MLVHGQAHQLADEGGRRHHGIGEQREDPVHTAHPFPERHPPRSVEMECPEHLLEEAHVAELFAEMISPDLLDQGPRTLVEKIGRYHLCEEFSHMRLFQEMLRTFHLDRTGWVPLGKWMSRVYRIFPLFPDPMMAPPAFVSELMGLTVYQHVDGVLDDILDDEPQARARVRQLLREIMTDELAHVGLRRNFMGAMGVRMAHLMVPAMYRAFFRDLPESRLLFDVDRMVHDGQAFDYSTISPEMIAQSWVPSYCRA